MKPDRYFYSINGTDVHGPVGNGELRQLWLDNRIGPSSFLCRAGEVTWAPCNPDDYPPQVRRARTMVIVPSKMIATLLAAEEGARHGPGNGSSSSVAVALEGPEDDGAKSRRVTIRLSSLPEMLDKALPASRSRSGRIPLMPPSVRMARDGTKSSDGAESLPLMAALFQPPVPAAASPDLTPALPKTTASSPTPVATPAPFLVEAFSKPPAEEKPLLPSMPPAFPIKPTLPDALPKLPVVAKRKPAAPPDVAPQPNLTVKPAPFYVGTLAAARAFLGKLAETTSPGALRPSQTEVLAIPGPPPSPAILPPEVEVSAPIASRPPPLPSPSEPKLSVLPEEGLIENEEESEDLGSFAMILNILAALAAIGAAALVAFLAHPAEGSDFYAFAQRSFAFIAALLVILGVPFLASRLAEGDLRVITRSGGMIVLAVVISIRYLIQPAYQPANEARVIALQQKQEAQKQIAAKGYYSGNSDLAEQNIENLKGQLTDDSERSRIGRAILTVTAELLDKVKASDAVEKSCKFTLEAVKEADDLAARSKAIRQLHSAQADVITFLQNYDQHCHEALDSDHIAASTQVEVTASARKGAHVDLLVALWQGKMKLSDDYVARFDFLRKAWGQWQLKDGEVVFPDQGQAALYDGLVQAVQDDIVKIHDTQRQIFQ